MMYFSPITVAALTPFILGLSQASAVRTALFHPLLPPNFPVPPPDPTLSSRQIQDAPPGVSLVPDLGLAAMSVISGTEYPPLGGGYPGDNYPGDWYDYKCDYWRDWDCYKKYWQQYKYCHPYDQSCYKDCKDYDDYYDHCKNYDKGYGKCYDRCYYDKDGCDKWQECRKDDYDCYKKKRKEDYCPPKEDRCKGKHEYPDDYCKPWDWKCHDKNKKDQEKDYECHPKKDKDCYPDYPDYPKYPDYDDHDKCKDDDCDDEHHDPQNYVSVTYHGPKGEWSHDVWPDGDENWLDEVSPGESLPSLFSTFSIFQYIGIKASPAFLPHRPLSIDSPFILANPLSPLQIPRHSMWIGSNTR